jgi:ubiquitin fusion degradation protein 1
MIDQLGLIEGCLVNIEYKSLPRAVYAKFKPLSTDFLQISNPRAMLEVELRKFACLTKNDVFAIQVCIEQ